MDQQLKERLVGAAVLVALTAIFVPMVLDGPAPPTAAVPPTLAPAPVDASTFGYDLSAPLPGASVAPPAGAETATAAPVATPATLAAVQAIAPKPSAAKPVAPKPAAPKATVPTPKPVAPSTGGWAAQVGSFSKEATAKAIADDLKSGGFKAFVMEHREGGKTYYRVRVGPVASREAAAALAGRITQQTKQAARPVRHP